MIAFIRRLFAPKARKPPADPRIAADPWLSGVFARLGERYQLAPDGSQILRRTGRARFNPMPAWVFSATRTVRGDYEVRGDLAGAKKLLDERVGARLTALGLSMASESSEEWAGTVLTRRYEGKCDSPEQAAAAVRFICEESETQVNLAAE